jgi:hypothetical protein
METLWPLFILLFRVLVSGALADPSRPLASVSASFANQSTAAAATSPGDQDLVKELFHCCEEGKAWGTVYENGCDNFPVPVKNISAKNQVKKFGSPLVIWGISENDIGKSNSFPAFVANRKLRLPKCRQDQTKCIEVVGTLH